MAYKETNVEFVPKILQGELLEFVKQHSLKLWERFPYDLGRGHTDPIELQQVKNALVRYADFHLENLSLFLKPKIEKITGLKLLPTYTYMRVYEKGMDLPFHTDRVCCEISVALCLARSNKDKDAWIFSGKYNGHQTDIKTDEGDGIVYNGIEVRHWREPCHLDYHIGAFLHYVDADGIYKGYVNDGRLHSYKKQRVVV